MHSLVIHGLSKDFVLRHNRNTSLKTRILATCHKDKRERREKFRALDNVTFSVEKGQALGLLGHNGSGKSTLLQIVAGILQPTSGRVYVNGRVAPLIQLGVGFNNELSGYDNIFLNGSLYGFQNKEIRKRLDAIVAFSELGHFINAPLKTYSSGMQMRLGFSIAMHVDPDILLADEILSVGDEAFQAKCLSKISELRASGLTILLVSHSPEQVNTFCERFIRLDHGVVVDQGLTERGTNSLKRKLTIV